MPVDRCVCFDVPFTELKEFAQRHGCGLAGLRDHFGCGRGCAMCVPYVLRMLESGQTSFPVCIDPVERTPGTPDL